MKIFVILCISIAPFIDADTLEGKLEPILLPFVPSIDPWLTPSEGILVNEYTQVFITTLIKSNNHTLFREIPKAIEQIFQSPLKESYEKARVDMIVRGKHPVSTAPETPHTHWPEILYPRIAVIVANDLFKTRFNENINDTIMYVLAFWNGVDNLFRPFSNPKIRFNIAAIIIEKSDAPWKFLASDPNNPDCIISHGCDDNGSTCDGTFEGSKSLLDFHWLVAMTIRKTCAADNPRNQGAATDGYSVFDTASFNDTLFPETFKRINIADSGYFFDIINAAHRLGNAFGIKSDIYRSADKSLRLPSCSYPQHRYIMDYGSRRSGNPYGFRWSTCSLNQLQRIFGFSTKSFMREAPKIGSLNIPRFLPGKVMTLDEMCRNLGHRKARMDVSEPCSNLLCEGMIPLIVYIHSLPIADGSSCDDNDPSKFCFFGECRSPSEFH